MNHKEILENQRADFKRRESALKDTIKWQSGRIGELEREVQRQTDLAQKDYYKERNKRLEREKQQLLNVLVQHNIVLDSVTQEA